MAVECGAKAALFAPDEKTAAFCGVDLADCDWLRFDGDARYERVLTYDAGTFRPYLSCPYGVDNVHPIEDVAARRWIRCSSAAAPMAVWRIWPRRRQC